jgi:hypothetical protein
MEQSDRNSKYLDYEMLGGVLMLFGISSRLLVYNVRVPKVLGFLSIDI